MEKIIDVIGHILGIGIGCVITVQIADILGRTAVWWMFLLIVPFIWMMYNQPQWQCKSQWGRIFALGWGVLLAIIGKMFILLVIWFGRMLIWFLF